MRPRRIHCVGFNPILIVLGCHPLDSHILFFELIPLLKFIIATHRQMFHHFLPALLLAGACAAAAAPENNLVSALGDIVPRRCGSSVTPDVVVRAEARFATYSKLVAGKLSANVSKGSKPANISVYWHVISANDTLAGGNVPYVCFPLVHAGWCSCECARIGRA